VLSLWPTVCLLSNENAVGSKLLEDTRNALLAAAKELSVAIPNMSAALYASKTPISDAAHFHSLEDQVDADIARAGPLFVENDPTADIAAINGDGEDDDDEDDDEDSDFEPNNDEDDEVPAREGGSALDVSATSAADPPPKGEPTETTMVLPDGREVVVVGEGGSNSQIVNLLRALMGGRGQAARKRVETVSANVGALLFRHQLDGGAPGDDGFRKRTKASGPVVEVALLDPRGTFGRESTRSGFGVAVARYRLRDWIAAGRPSELRSLPKESWTSQPPCGTYCLPPLMSDAPSKEDIVAFVTAALRGDSPELLTGPPLEPEMGALVLAGEEVPRCTMENNSILGNEREARNATEGVEWLESKPMVDKCWLSPDATGRAVLAAVVAGLPWDVELMRSVSIAQAVLDQHGVPVEAAVLGYRTGDAWGRIFPRGDEEDLRLFLPSTAPPAAPTELSDSSLPSSLAASLSMAASHDVHAGGWAAVPGAVGPGLRNAHDLVVPSVGFSDWQRTDTSDLEAAPGSSIRGGVRSGGGGGGGAMVTRSAADDESNDEDDEQEEGRKPAPKAWQLVQFVCTVINRSRAIAFDDKTMGALPMLSSSGMSLVGPDGDDPSRESLLIDVAAIVSLAKKQEILVRAADELIGNAERALEAATSMGMALGSDFVALRDAVSDVSSKAHIATACTDEGAAELSSAMEALSSKLEGVNHHLDASEWELRKLDSELDFQGIAAALAEPDADAMGLVLIHEAQDADSLSTFNLLAQSTDANAIFCSLCKADISDIASVGLSDDTPLPCVAVLAQGDVTILDGLDPSTIMAALESAP
jgi:hypothetical protein